VFDPHAVKIHIDGNCWENPGGAGGFAVRVDWGCDIDRESGIVEYLGRVADPRSAETSWVAFDKSEGVVKAQNSPAVFFPPRDCQSGGGPKL